MHIRIHASNIFELIAIFAVFLIVFAIIRGDAKRFLFELIDHIKGTSSGKTAPKQKKNNTPPWEE